jgi:DMSO/TMAO reductase YedYZ molybdopterin-dependent catalytic subunit
VGRIGQIGGVGKVKPASPDLSDPRGLSPRDFSRRDFLASALFLPALLTQTSSARFVSAVPLGNPAGFPTAPLGRLLGAGLDARLFTDLSPISRDKPETLLTATDRFYIRTAAPSLTVAPPAGIDLTTLEAKAVQVGPFVMECAGNADPANFGLISAATWGGIPMPLILDRLPSSSPGARVLVSGVDDPGPAVTSIPGASWIFSRDDLQRALLVTRMNGAPLNRDHGAPVRLLVPGWYGCACIKWVESIALVPDDSAATTQMREFAARTHQSPGATLARDFGPAAIDTAAMPVRVEKWSEGGRVVYRIAGIIWGGSKPTNALSIRFRSGGPWVKVDNCPLPASTLTWAPWSHSWRPQEPGRYQIVLRVDDPSIRTRRLDLFFYVREVQIDEESK